MNSPKKMEAEKDSGRRLVCSFFFFFQICIWYMIDLFFLLLFLAAFSFLFCILQEDRKKNIINCMQKEASSLLLQSLVRLRVSDT